MILSDPHQHPSPCVATIGFFDGFHLGHQHLLRQVCRTAQEEGLHSLAITFTNHPRTVTSPDFVPQLLTTWPERRDLLLQSGIDYLLPLRFDSALARMTAQQFMEQIIAGRCRARILLIGYDHRFGHNRAEGFADYARYGTGLGLQVRPVDAARFLGRPYELGGTVVGGLQRGREIGFPTANISPAPEKLVPADGVYTAEAWCEKAAAPFPESDSTSGQERQPFEGKRLAVVNIGTCPTVRQRESYRTIEAHLPGYSGNLYGLTLRLRFLRRMREQRKFASIDELRQQLARDCQAARDFYATHF